MRHGRRAAARGTERLADAANARLPVPEGGPPLRKAFPGHGSFLPGELAPRPGPPPVAPIG
ncbi:hypothetical protein [Streptomyces sp. NPDC002386]